ncbi:MAG TPA: MmgE/PrpD family protein [Bryobacteraceae bacterium]|nr:MmgE/PrpD family protein [Bryobacteraceae bacterium]
MPLPLSKRIAREAQSLDFDSLPQEAVQKVEIALLDYLSCAFESRDLGPSLQAVDLAKRSHGPATVVGFSIKAAAPEAAFANAVLGHGLVREDMHTGSVSHLGVVIFPALLALAESSQQPVTGRDFVVAAVCGYETGAAVGRALMESEVVKRFRPTGVTGPVGAAMAGARLKRLSEEAATSALGLAANAAGGFNEWPARGADEMFFHAGFAARNAVTAVQLAELGAFASESALDGPAGLFAALGKRQSADRVALFSAERLEILSVYHKPAPACNYAQTPCQVARLLAVEDRVPVPQIAQIEVKVSSAALHYPGCNATGPFERVLQAKMSIQYCVAATLLRGAIEEANYRLLGDPELKRLVDAITLQEEAAFTAAYPGAQGTEIAVTLHNGRVLKRRLDDLVPATPDQVRHRFRVAATNTLGSAAAAALEEAAGRLPEFKNAAALAGFMARKDQDAAAW